MTRKTNRDTITDNGRLHPATRYVVVSDDNGYPFAEQFMLRADAELFASPLPIFKTYVLTRHEFAELFSMSDVPVKEFVL